MDVESLADVSRRVILDADADGEVARSDAVEKESGQPESKLELEVSDHSLADGG